MGRDAVSLDAVNSCDQARFVETLGFLFEGSPWIAAEAWHSRPFKDLDALHGALCSAMYHAPVERQVALIRAHPDLVGKAALEGTLTPESNREQAEAGLDRLSPDEIALFNRLNQSYRARFDFPFVLCARENKKESIIAGFERRLDNSREQEIATALDEIAKIARLRLLDTVTQA